MWLWWFLLWPILYGVIWLVIKKYVFSDTFGVFLHVVYSIEFKHYAVKAEDYHTLTRAVLFMLFSIYSVIRIATHVLWYGFVDLQTVTMIVVLSHSISPNLPEILLSCINHNDPLIIFAMLLCSTIDMIFTILKSLDSMHKLYITGDTLVSNRLKNYITSYLKVVRSFPHMRRILVTALLMLYIAKIEQVNLTIFLNLYWFTHMIFYV